MRHDYSVPMIIMNDCGYNRFNQAFFETFPDVQEGKTSELSNIEIAQVKDFCYQNFWKKHRYFEIKSRKISIIIFSLAIKTSPRRAHKILQKALCSTGRVVSIDGIIGNQTLHNMNSMMCVDLKKAIQQEIKRYRKQYPHKNSTNKIDIAKHWRLSQNKIKAPRFRNARLVFLPLTLSGIIYLCGSVA